MLTARAVLASALKLAQRLCRRREARFDLEQIVRFRHSFSRPSDNHGSVALAAGALYAWGVLLTPAVGAALMAASTVIVAINARLLRLKK